MTLLNDRCRALIAELNLGQPEDVIGVTPLKGGVASDIARALMTNPKLLILDEATEGLAPLIRKKIWESLELIKEDGMSILIVDKNLKDLLQIADQHNIIHKGVVVWSGSSSELEEASDIRSQYLGV
jgi:branched-chain amino acid transport system ATP-binding protein